MAKVPQTTKNFMKCKCLTCPSYTTQCKLKEIPRDFLKMAEGVGNADHMEGLFCSFGKSECIAQYKGCVCDTCAIHKEYNLTGGVFCLNGPAE